MLTVPYVTVATPLPSVPRSGVPLFSCSQTQTELAWAGLGWPGSWRAQAWRSGAQALDRSGPAVRAAPASTAESTTAAVSAATATVDTMIPGIEIFICC